MGARRHLAIVLALVSSLVLLPGRSAAASSTPGLLEAGSEGAAVALLQAELAERGLYRGLVDGRFGQDTAQAVMAFKKHLGLERTFTWTADDWLYLEVFVAPRPMPHDQLVVDLNRQLLYAHLGGSVAIIPISSGDGGLFRNRSGRWSRATTPEGSFELTRHINGLRRSYLGVLWRPWYFYGGYAIHGSPSVPGEPASHGCIRVPNWEADWLAGQLRLGIPVHIGRSGDLSPPPLPDQPTAPLWEQLDDPRLVGDGVV